MRDESQTPGTAGDGAADDWPRLDRSAFSIGSLSDESDDKAFWHSKTPEERLRAMELMRQIAYGYGPAAAWLQRASEVAGGESMKSSPRLEEYQEFIDALVRIRPCVLVQWVKERGWPQLPDNERFNRLLSELTPEQKDIVAEMAEQTRDGGIHDVLAYLSDEIQRGGLRLVRNGIELAVEPYGTPMHYDWVSRREGDVWPEDHFEDEDKAE